MINKKTMLMAGVFIGVFVFSVGCYFLSNSNNLGWFCLPFGGITSLICGIVRANIYSDENHKHSYY